MPLSFSFVFFVLYDPIIVVSMVFSIIPIGSLYIIPIWNPYIRCRLAVIIPRPSVSTRAGGFPRGMVGGEVGFLREASGHLAGESGHPYSAETWGLGFRGLGFTGLGFRGLSFGGLGFGADGTFASWVTTGSCPTLQRSNLSPGRAHRCKNAVEDF